MKLPAHSAGRHEVHWNGLDMHGRRASSGVYFYQMEAAGIKAIDFVV